MVKTYKEKQSAFRSLFRSVSPEIPVSDLTKSDVLQHFTALSVARSGNAVNKDRKNLVAAWRWGQSYLEGFPGMNPFQIDRFPEERYPRYIPTIQDFWKVYQVAESEQDRVMLLCYLYFAARRNEVFSMKREDIELKRRQVRLYTRKRKDGSLEFDWIPIADQLYSTLRDHVQDMPSGSWVFPNPSTGLPYFERGKWMRRLCRLAE